MLKIIGAMDAAALALGLFNAASALQQFSLRTHSSKPNFVELYNLEGEPEELTDLAETDPSMVSALRAVLHRDQTIAENISLRAKQPFRTVSALSAG